MTLPVFLEGDRVALRPIEEFDLEFLQRGINDPGVWKSLAANTPINMRQERNWFERVSDADDTIVLVVSVDDDSVGTVGFNAIDDRFGHAEVGFWITPERRGHGYATDATALLVGYGFDHLALHKVYAHVYDFNDASKRVLEKVGFVEEGVHREEAFVDGAYRDVHRYGLLRGDWTAESG